MKCGFRLLSEDSKETLKRNYQKKKAFFIDKMPVDTSCSKNDQVVAHHELLTNNKSITEQSEDTESTLIELKRYSAWILEE